MFTEILIAILIGITGGIITGLIPGIHVNLISLLLLTSAPFLLQYTSPLYVIIIIIAMAITHSFLDPIPSIFLGAPDADQALGVLPGHRMLLEGKGYDAVKLTIIGSLMTLILMIIATPLSIQLAPSIYTTIKPYIAHILIAVVVYAILTEKTYGKKAWALGIFLASGTLGIIIFNTPNLSEPLFPLFSGLYGIATLLLALKDTSSLPTQRLHQTITISKKETIKAASFAGIAGGLTGLLPGLGSAQAAMIATSLWRNIHMHTFMILIGGINTANFLFSLITYYTIEKARNGAIIVVSKILPIITLDILVIILIATLITAGTATIISLYLTKVCAKLVSRIKYRTLCLSVISLIAILVLFISHIHGFLILIIATALGIIAPLVNVKRTHAMGCLLLPVMLYFI